MPGKRKQKGQQLSQSKSGTDSWSLEGCDSNAIMLPAKKKNKKNGPKQGFEKKTLSKSEKRKLKKLEEEKARELLLSKTMEDLEKYKIPEDAYSLLQRTCNIGQDETKLEKRRRDMHLAQAGLEMQHNVQNFKQKGDDDIACEAQLDSDIIQMKPDLLDDVRLNTHASLGSYPVPVSSSNNRVNGEYFASVPVKEVSDIGGSMVTQENMKVSPSMTCLKSKECIDDPLKEDSINMTEQSDRPLQRPLFTSFVVHVSRPNEVQKTRNGLPIVMMEQEIMEAIHEHSTVIICGETGCGKTTQLPQFLYEAGFGSKKSRIIGVTQPRRVAVLSTAKRVAYELGLSLGKEIGFQVRHDKMITKNSSIKFMTDGILLREVKNDILLNDYSVIILDEVHERSVNTDILIAMLSRSVLLRQKEYESALARQLFPENVIPPLKLILMSATMRVEDFISGRRLFPTPPPVIEVPTRQFPVTIHFAKSTERVDYVGQAYKKIMSIHKRLPPGGILVFVTGQREVEYLCGKLRKASNDLLFKSSKSIAGTGFSSASATNEEDNMKEISEAYEIHGSEWDQPIDRFSSWDDGDLDGSGSEEHKSDLSYDSATESDLDFANDLESLNQEIPEENDELDDVLGDERTLASLDAAFKALSGNATSKSDTIVTSEVDPDKSKQRRYENSVSLGALCILPLYAMLPAVAQLRVFENVKEGERLVVVATNVAETSLTIPGITYVVDTGREKVKSYNPTNGMEKYEVQWISKASAAQRAGRAGRTGPGHSYRLYSSACFQNNFPDYSVAEISKIPVDGIILLLKSMHIPKVANFPFPTPPDPSALVEAERCLKTLEALDDEGKLTPLGNAMSHFPMSPRHSRMLLTVIQTMRNVKKYARANLVLGYGISAAAALSLSTPFVMQFEGNDSEKDVLDQNEKHRLSCSEKVADKQEKMKKKKLKEIAKLSRAKFANPSSDALGVAYALQCFELSEKPAEFCNEHALHLKTMEEMSKLRKQLLQLVFNRSVGGGLDEDFCWSHGSMEDVEKAWMVFSEKNPLLLNEEELLGQAICAGWADRVAKRVRVSKSLTGDGKANAVRYQASMVEETVFLHRHSSVARTNEFLVYNELLQTKRPYMHGATGVKPAWILKYARSLCSFSAPIADRNPYYDPSADQVLCWVTPTFGPHLWQLPDHPMPINNIMQRVSAFAYALLEGQILPCLKNVRKNMALPPSTLLRPESSGQERVGNLLNGLRTKFGPICSCAMLKEAWKNNPKKLYMEILGWFQKSFHSAFEELWSRMQCEILLSAQERFPEKIKRGKKKLLV